MEDPIEDRHPIADELVNTPESTETDVEFEVIQKGDEEVDVEQRDGVESAVVVCRHLAALTRRRTEEMEMPKSFQLKHEGMIH
jgi:hypothetical protein